MRFLAIFQKMFSTSLDMFDDVGDEEGLEAFNVRIIHQKKKIEDGGRSEISEDNYCYKFDSLVTSSLLDMTKLQCRIDDKDDALDDCDNKQDIPEQEQTQLSATILGTIQR